MIQIYLVQWQQQMLELPATVLALLACVSRPLLSLCLEPATNSVHVESIQIKI